MAFALNSTAFSEGETIPQRYTCDGQDLSPPLAWKDPPAGSTSFALIMDDPDAPVGTWVHWVLYNLPGTSLEEGVPRQENLPNGAKNGATWGVSDFSKVGYHGPCPPPGKPHRYSFRLYALDKTLDLVRATRFDVEKAMKGHVLGEARLMVKYGR